MKQWLVVLLAILLPGVLRAAPPASAPSALGIMAEFDAKMSAFSVEYQKATTDAQRQKILNEKYPDREAYAGRLIKLANASPTSREAYDAARWVVVHGPQSAEATSMLEILKNFAADSGLVDVIRRLDDNYSPATQSLLETVLAKNPDRKTCGYAQLVLGIWLKNRADLSRDLEGKPDNEMVKWLGQATMDDIRKHTPQELAQKAEAALTQVVEKYADVAGSRGPLGEAAKAQLFEMRNLGIGKTAPEIEGTTVDGKTMKLSEYRGKVVVLDFFGDW